MAEEQAAVQEPEAIPFQIKIEDAGPATKKVSIEVPQEVIASKLEEQFTKLICGQSLVRTYYDESRRVLTVIELLNVGPVFVDVCSKYLS